ncbi:putative quinol monooxygenase [Patulibacter sp.]|uniref:putative quinol monooxygenase n=1 Tax=Patulibacter sp. TaxID=1912859 RepID=UPI0027257D80|nr:antibiotic biosynthesis monooxygenase [Patulibacter sp.]MDO9407959.1 antibiotic biosynthesis monooxygenase [Patulibacter sp.]
MLVVALFDLHAAPGRADDVAAVLHRILVDTRAFDGNREATVIRDLDDPHHITVLNRWDSTDHHDAYLAWRAGDGAVTDLGPLLDRDPGGSRHEVDAGA